MATSSPTLNPPVTTTPTSLSPSKPILLLTHTRSLSTAFSRIWMTHEDVLYIHEPFGDAFYFGPEKISPAFAGPEGRERCINSGCSETTYGDVVVNLETMVRENPNKRIFIKDMAYHIVSPYPEPSPSSPPSSLATPDAPSDQDYPNSTSRPLPSLQQDANPSLLPPAFLNQFPITILIRRPELSVPSKYKFTVPPLNQKTRIKFYENEIGYRELRSIVEWLSTQQSHASDDEEANRVVIIDADDLLVNPYDMVRKYAQITRLPFHEDMLRWDNEEGKARELVKKYENYHRDVVSSRGLGMDGKGRDERTMEEHEEEWSSKYGDDGADVIKRVVQRDRVDYDWLWERRLKL